jgi:type IV pilus assembly protein PilW
MRLNHKNRNIFSAGFTLIEVLLASVMGLALIGVVLQNYLSTKNIYRVQTKIASLSENIRFTNFFLQQNIMHAGFTGCRKISELNLSNHIGEDAWRFDVIRGHNSEQLPNYLLGKVASGTDVIVISKANSDITKLTADAQMGAASIRVGKNPATQFNRYLLISDCDNADLFIADNWSGSVITTKNKLNHSYQVGKAQVGRFEELSFFISKTRRVTAKNKSIYSVYFSVNRGKKQELIPEVADMQIVYGIEDRGRVDRYLKSAEIDALSLWDRVLSVVITLKPQSQLLALDKWKIYIKLRERG